MPTIARCLLGRSEPDAAMIGWNLDFEAASQKVLFGDDSW